MISARMLCAPLALVSLLCSQNPGPATQPAATQAQQEVANRPLTPQERAAVLKKELEKLQKEQAFIDDVERNGGLGKRVRAVVTDRKIVSSEIADPNYKPAQTAAQQTEGLGGAPVIPRKKARLLGDAEKQKLSPDVVMTVDGLPILKSDVETTANYFKSYTAEASDDALKTRAIRELVKARATEAAFPLTTAAAKKKIEAAEADLAAGKKFEDVAKAVSDCPSKEQGGDLSTFPRENMMDLLFCQAAFSQKVGEVSKVTRTAFGYHLIKTTAFQKGATPIEDTVRASHILALYTPDQMQVRQAAMKVQAGNVDIGFVDDAWRKLCPPEFN